MTIKECIKRFSDPREFGLIHSRNYKKFIKALSETTDSLIQEEKINLVIDLERNLVRETKIIGRTLLNGAYKYEF